MKDLMVDIETLGCGTLPVITSLAAVQFDLETGKCGRRFYKRIEWSPSEYSRKSCSIDPETVLFWLRQNEDVTQELIREDNRHPLKESLTELCELVEELKIKAVWGNGVLFDNRILREHLNHLGIKPWHFRIDADVRTLVQLGKRAQINTRDVGLPPQKHHALHDCIHQIKYCHYIHSKLCLPKAAKGKPS